MVQLHPTSDQVETFLLVELRTAREAARQAELRLAELERLVDSAGGEIAETTIVTLRGVNPGYYVSPRRCETLAQRVQELAVTGVVIDAPLSPAQSRNLEDLFSVKVLDRTAVILDIFARRARTHEGRLQVEHAQLRYLLPRLTGHGRAMSRLGGGIGTRGPGETKLETDRRRILARISQLQKAIEALRRHRTTQRRRRLRTGLPTASVVGYTNAGKSTLINRLTGADIYAAEQLFATLDPTARALTLPHGLRLAVVDTVGFIRDLPPSLTAAFRATLEEMNYSDLLIQVVDASSPNRAEELRTTDAVLAELELADLPRVLAWNKIDRLGGTEAGAAGAGTTDISRGQGGPRSDARDPRSDVPQVRISGLTGEGCDDLLDAVESLLTKNYVLDTFLVPYNRLEQMNELRQRGQILSERYEEEGLRVTARIPPALAANLSPYEVTTHESRSRKRTAGA